MLILDADESLSPRFEKEIRAFLNGSHSDSYGAANVRLSYHFGGKELKHGHTVNKVVLVNRTKVFFPEFDDLNVKNMWEVEGHYQPSIKGRTFKFKATLTHSDPGSLYEYFSRHNRYSDWEAHLTLNKHLQDDVQKSRSWQGRIFSRAPIKPLLFFAYSYVFRQGWRDGRAGFDYAVALSFYYWQISAKRRELLRSTKDHE